MMSEEIQHIHYKPWENLLRAVSYMACSAEPPLQRLKTAYVVNLFHVGTDNCSDETGTKLKALKKRMEQPITDDDVIRITDDVVGLFSHTAEELGWVHGHRGDAL